MPALLPRTLKIQDPETRILQSATVLRHYGGRCCDCLLWAGALLAQRLSTRTSGTSRPGSACLPNATVLRPEKVSKMAERRRRPYQEFVSYCKSGAVVSSREIPDVVLVDHQGEVSQYKSARLHWGKLERGRGLPATTATVASLSFDDLYCILSVVFVIRAPAATNSRNQLGTSPVMTAWE